MVKVCGITSETDLALAEEAGASHVGFVVDPGSRRFVTLERAIALGESCRTARPVIVSRSLDANGVPLHFVRQANVHLHNVPGAEHWLSTRGDSTDFTSAQAVVLDAHSQEGLGGTGILVPADFAAEFVAECPRPVILAGGLGPENVAEAIERVRPIGVDACTGPEREPGVKDPELLRAYVRIAQEALRRAHGEV
ncbi:MAG: phosphoribosylanthranilate isomerase [Fimbriimonadaceae bacterium]|nr:phosphoribosylanthranilate isomerase [Fimbriimonadaceae bacterium]